MPVSLVQTKGVGGVSGTQSLIMDSALTAGNALFVLFGRHDGFGPIGATQSAGPTLSDLTPDIGAGNGSGVATIAHATFGSPMFMRYRKIVGGDSNSFSWSSDDYTYAIFAEFSGLNSAVNPSGSLASASGVNSTTVGLAVTPGAGVFVIAGFTTRLHAGDGVFTVNGSSTRIGGNIGAGNSSGVMVYGQGNVTLGGTQSGGTTDGYWYGGHAFSWSVLAPTRAHLIGIIG